MNSKLATYGTLAIIILFVVSTFAVILYVPSNGTAGPTPTPPALTVQFSGTGSGQAVIDGFSNRFVVECNSTNSSAVANAIKGFTVQIAGNGTNSTNQAIAPFASVIAASTTIFLGAVNATSWQLALGQLGASNLFFRLQLSLLPYCQANIVRDALIQVNKPIVFQTSQPVDSSNSSTPSNYTVFPLDFQGYANVFSQQNGGPAFVHAFTLPQSGLNSTIDVQALVTVNSNLLSTVFMQQYLGGPSSALIPNIIALTAPVSVVSWTPGMFQVEGVVPWAFRGLLGSSTQGSLNASPYFDLSNFLYQPDNSVLVNLTLAGLSNQTDFAAKAMNLTFVTDAVPQGANSVALVVGNSTNQSAILFGLSGINVPQGAVTFPTTALSFQVLFKNNSTEVQAQSFVTATVQAASNITFLQAAKVSPVDVAGLSIEAQAIVPPQFSAFIDPAQVNSQNEVNLTITAITEGTRTLSIQGQSA